MFAIIESFTAYFLPQFGTKSQFVSVMWQNKSNVIFFLITVHIEQLYSFDSLERCKSFISLKKPKASNN